MICRDCGGDWPLVAFRKNRKLASDRYIYPVCRLCEQTNRDDAKNADRFRSKARDTIRRHGQKWGMSPSEFADRFGWTIDAVAHEMEHAWGNGCIHCRVSYSDMKNGLWDMTVDIEDPDADPFWGANTRIVCATCNREKSTTPKHEWGAIAHYRRMWMKRRARFLEGQITGMPLFDYFKQNAR